MVHTKLKATAENEASGCAAGSAQTEIGINRVGFQDFMERYLVVWP